MTRPGCIKLLFLMLLWLPCGQAQTSQLQRLESPLYWIPELGLMAAFPYPPTLSNQRSSAPHFSEVRLYECQMGYQTDSTYFWHIGVYRYRAKKDTSSTTLLEQGLSMNRSVINDFGAKILLDEPIVYKGLPAHRLKSFFPGNPAKGINPFYFQMLFFVREGYFVEMATFNAASQGKEWKDDVFFTEIHFGETCSMQKNSAATAVKPSSNGILGRRLCFPSQGLSLYSPQGALLVRRGETSLYRQTKYHLAVAGDTLPQMYGIEFFESKSAPLQHTDSLFSTVMPLLLQISEQKYPSKQDRTISKQMVHLKGKVAFEVVMERDLLPEMPGYPGYLLFHTLSFIHRGNLVMLFTYRKHDIRDTTTRQFFDSVEWSD